MTSLRFEGVACVRGQRLLFEGFGLALGPGEAALVTGPNGVGKSSLLRLAAGLLEPAAGTILREGRIALADENAALDRAATLAKALLFWARLDGGGAADVVRALAAMGMAHLTEVPVRLLSTGQRKRATLARVIAGRAEIWLLDEPGNGLDAESLALLETAVAAHLVGGGAVLAASHQPLGLGDARIVPLTPPPFIPSEVEGLSRAEPRPPSSSAEVLGSARTSVSTSLDTNGFGDRDTKSA